MQESRWLSQEQGRRLPAVPIESERPLCERVMRMGAAKAQSIFSKMVDRDPEPYEILNVAQEQRSVLTASQVMSPPSDQRPKRPRTLEEVPGRQDDGHGPFSPTREQG